MARRAARDLLLLPHFPSVELRDGHRALGRSTQRRLQCRHHRVSLENEVVDARNSLGNEPSGPGRFLSSHSGSVVFLQSRAGPLPEGSNGPGARSQLPVAGGYTDTPVHLALALWPCRPVVYRQGALTSWRSQFQLRDRPASQCKVAVKGSAGGSSAVQWPTAGVFRPSCGQVPPVIWGTLRLLFEHGVIKLERRSVIIVESLPSGKTNGDQRLIIDVRIPNTAFEAPDPVALAICVLTGQIVTEYSEV